MDRYEGPLELGMILTAPDNNGEMGFRRVRLVAMHIDGGWLYEDLPARMWPKIGPDGSIRRCPELNLRVVFVPEDPALRDRDGVVDMSASPLTSPLATPSRSQSVGERK